MLKDLWIVFGNIALLYKNFIHWTISRLVIFITWVLLWFLLSIPFFILSIVFASIDSISWFNIAKSIAYTQGVSMELISAFSNNFWMFFLQIFLWLMLFFSFIFWIQYSTICIYNLNLNYIKWNKLNFWENYYFNFKKIYKYLKVISLISLFLLIPIVLFFVSSFLVVNFYWPIELIVIWLLLVAILVFVYLIYRLAFSLIIFLERWYENVSTYEIVKKSFNVTKWFVFFKVALIYIICSLVLISIFLILGIVISLWFYFAWTPIDLAWEYTSKIINIFSFVFVYWVPQMLFVSVYFRYFRENVIWETLDDKHIEENDDEIDDEENI